MLNFLTALGTASTVQIEILAVGCGIFGVIVLSEQCPFCSWFEWIGPQARADDLED